MFAIAGILLVFGAIVGGYLMEHGNLRVLIQPAELLIIGGAGIGTVLTANPPAVLKALLNGLSAVFGNSKYDKSLTISATLKQLYDVMQKARKKGSDRSGRPMWKSPRRANCSKPGTIICATSSAIRCAWR